MPRIYSEQQKADNVIRVNRFMENIKKVDITVKKEIKDKWQHVADENGKSLQRFILDAIEVEYHNQIAGKKDETEL